MVGLVGAAVEALEDDLADVRLRLRQLLQLGVDRLLVVPAALFLDDRLQGALLAAPVRRDVVAGDAALAVLVVSCGGGSGGGGAGNNVPPAYAGWNYGFADASPPNVALFTAPVDLVVADLDNDGSLDVVVASSSPGRVTVARGHGDGTFDAPVTYLTAGMPVQMAVGDLDEDGFLDLVVGLYDTGGVAVFLNAGDGSLLAPTSYPAGSGTGGVVVGAFDAVPA